MIQGEKFGVILPLVSHLKVLKRLRQGYGISGKRNRKNPDEKYTGNIPVTRKYLYVLPDEPPGLPPTQHMEFHMDLISGAIPITQGNLSSSTLRNIRINYPTTRISRQRFHKS